MKNWQRWCLVVALSALSLWLLWQAAETLAIYEALRHLPVW